MKKIFALIFAVILTFSIFLFAGCVDDSDKETGNETDNSQDNVSDGVTLSENGLFVNGTTIIRENGKYGVIDKQGEYVIECNYDNMARAGDQNIFIAGIQGHPVQIIDTQKVLYTASNAAYNTAQVLKNFKGEVVAYIPYASSAEYVAGGQKNIVVNAEFEEIKLDKSYEFFSCTNNRIYAYSDDYCLVMSIDFNGGDIVTFDWVQSLGSYLYPLGDNVFTDGNAFYNAKGDIIYYYGDARGGGYWWNEESNCNVYYGERRINGGDGSVTSIHFAINCGDGSIIFERKFHETEYTNQYFANKNGFAHISSEKIILFDMQGTERLSVNGARFICEIKDEAVALGVNDEIRVYAMDTFTQKYKIDFDMGQYTTTVDVTGYPIIYNNAKIIKLTPDGFTVKDIDETLSLTSMVSGYDKVEIDFNNSKVLLYSWNEESILVDFSGETVIDRHPVRQPLRAEISPCGFVVIGYDIDYNATSFDNGFYLTVVYDMHGNEIYQSNFGLTVYDDGYISSCDAKYDADGNIIERTDKIVSIDGKNIYSYTSYFE